MRRRTKRRRSKYNRGRRSRRNMTFNRGRHRSRRRKGRKTRRNKGAWQRHVAAVLRRGGTMKQASKSFRR